MTKPIVFYHPQTFTVIHPDKADTLLQVKYGQQINAMTPCAYLKSNEHANVYAVANPDYFKTHTFNKLSLEPSDFYPESVNNHESLVRTADNLAHEFLDKSRSDVEIYPIFQAHVNPNRFVLGNECGYLDKTPNGFNLYGFVFNPSGDDEAWIFRDSFMEYLNHYSCGEVYAYEIKELSVPKAQSSNFNAKAFYQENGIDLEVDSSIGGLSKLTHEVRWALKRILEE